MGRFVLCAACFFAAIPVATAQVQIEYQTYAIGCQRITDFVPVEALAPAAKAATDAKVPVAAKLESVSAKNWNNGVQFTDATGRLWRLAYGPALKQSPPQLSGTLTNTADGRVLFLTNEGTLFVRVEK